MAQHLIEIKVDEGGIVPIRPLTVKRGDLIRWKSDAGNFCVLFEKVSPCPLVHYGAARQIPSVPGLVAGADGKYKYSVIVHRGPVVLVMDPEIIVNDGE